MGKRRIDQWTWDYWLVQQYVKFCYRIFYKKISVKNLQNIPKNQPIVLAPNHQNALMDALVFVCNTPFQIVFMARADIFKGRILIHFLRFLNIMPIYRIRDGIDNVRRNEEVFEKTLQVFRNKLNPIGMFPEGNHGDKRRLRPLVKGIFRMTLQAQEDYKEEDGVKIIPIGLDYGHYSNFRTTLLINIGKPIEVSEYYKTYEEDKVKAINELKDRLSIEISKLMIDVQNEIYYELYLNLRSIYNKRMREVMHISGNTLYDRFLADKKMIELLDKAYHVKPSGFSEIDIKVKNYLDQVKSLNIRDWIVAKGRFSKLIEFLKIFTLILLSPIVLLGLINNLLPYKIIESLGKKIKDEQFRSSVKFVLGMVLFPLYYIILSVLAAILIPGSLFSWIYIILIPISGIFAYSYYIWFKKQVGKLKFLSYMKKNKGRKDNLIEKRKEIITLVDQIILNAQNS